jgi:uncharacterized membrane protein
MCAIWATSMSELILAIYADDEAAEHILGVLRARPAGLPGELDSSVTVRVGADGEYSLTMTGRAGSTEAFSEVLWEALFGLIFLVPRAGTAYGANLGGLFGAIDRAGLDAEFRTRVRAALGHTTSAVALIATGWNPQAVLREFPLAPTTLLRASLALDENSELLRELGGKPPGGGS